MVPMPQSLVELKDIGDFALEAVDTDKGFYYYLVAQTDRGNTTFYSWGPTVPDVDIPVDKYTFSINIMEYNEKKLVKFIDRFLNSCGATEAKIITIDEAIEQAKNEKDFLRNGQTGN